MAVDTTQLNKALAGLIPSIDTKGEADTVAKSGLLESLQSFTSSLSSYSAKASNESKDKAKQPRTVRTTAEDRANAIFGEQGKAPTEEAIFKKNKRLAQGQIDMIKQQTDQVIQGDLEAGTKIQARARALNNNSGLGGSTFATKNAQNVDSEIDKVVQSRRREQDAKINELLSGVATRSSAEFQTERQNFLKNAQDRLDLIEEFNTNLRETAKTDITSLVANGVTLDSLKGSEPDTYNQLLEDVGGSQELLNAMFASAVPADQVLYESNVNGRFVQVIQDPVTGEQRKQEFDLGEDYRTDGLKLLTKTASGQLVFAPDVLTDPSQLKIYGAVGQFGDAGGGKGGTKDIYTFDTAGKEELISGGFSGGDVKNLQSDINEYGLDEAIAGLDAQQQAIVRRAIKQEEEDTKLDRGGVAKFLGISNPDDDTPGATTKSGGFLGFGGTSTTAPSPKQTVDQIMQFVDSYKALGLTDEQIRKEILDAQKAQQKKAEEDAKK
jgi:hypothetical protein